MAITDYDFDLSRTSIIEAALSKVGAIKLGQTPSGNQVKQAANYLNLILKSWQAVHRFQYTLSHESVTLVDGDADYNLSADPLIISVEKAWYRDSSGTDHPLRYKSYSDYMELSDKTDSGQPSFYTVKYGSQNELFLYPVPGADEDSKTVRLLAVKAFQDMDSPSDTPDMQQKFLRALIYALAEDLADDYALDLRERKHIANKAASGLQAILLSDYDRSDDDFVEPCF